MKIKQIKIYTIDELSDEAKEKAHFDYLSSDIHYCWSENNKATLDAFCNIFPIKVTNWSYGDRNYINSTMETADSDTEKIYYDITGIRLLKYIVNNYWHDLFKPKYLGRIKGKLKYSRCQFSRCCVLTGYCIDDDILQPIHDFLKRPDENMTFEDLLKECLECWVAACNDDYESCCSLDYFIDAAQANECEYDEYGNMV